MKNILEVKDMNLWYSNFHALKNINMEIPENQITAFIGPSGCGKSTFLKSLNRMNDLVDGVKITGSIIYDNQNILDANIDVNQVENIVDLATNLDSTYAENYLSIRKMAEATIRMVKLSIQAFVNKNLEMAKEAKLYDDIIDEFFCLIKNDLINIIQQNPDSGEYAIDVLMIAKYFERIGDHATNIAEWVEFSITGMHGE